jgi:hypothetical protein
MDAQRPHGDDDEDAAKAGGIARARVRRDGSVRRAARESSLTQHELHDSGREALCSLYDSDAKVGLVKCTRASTQTFLWWSNPVIVTAQVAGRIVETWPYIVNDQRGRP